MPKINIYESDLTTAGGLDASSNVVYIPGFYKKGSTGEVNSQGIEIKDGIKLFKTTDEFKSYFSYQQDGGGYKFEYLKVTNGTTNASTGEYIYNIPERSMVYALEVLQIGLPVLFNAKGINSSSFSGTDYDNTYISETNLTTYFDKNITTLYPDELKDRNNYNIKFITSGGYSNKGKESTLLEIASKRGDCIALIDHDEDDKFATVSGLYKATGVGENGKYGAMFTPWCTFNFSSKEAGFKMPLINMPGSLAYLLAFGMSVANNNPNWLAAAGASRGVISGLVEPLEYLTESQIDTYALTDEDYIGTAINPIAQINPYGVIVWGNRTLFNNVEGLVASSFLNIRHLTNDIKKTIYTACKSITFEQNNDLTWLKFKSLITPLLDRMQSGNGIAGYELKKKKSLKKATLTATIRIYPIEALEDFEMTVELADDSTEVTG